MGVTTSLLLLALGLILSAFFSGAETALTALPVSRAESLASRGGRVARAAWRRWRDRPHRVLVALLIGSTLVNVGVSAIATSLTIDLFGNRWLGAAVGVVTLTVLVLGEVTPKTLARVAPEALARRVIRVVGALDWMLTPVTLPLLGLSHLIGRIRRVPLDGAPTAATPEDLRFLLSLARQEGHLSELQHGMLEAVLRFEQATARDVQVPRTDVVFLADELPVDEVRRRVLAHGYSRYPVYHGRDDNVLGILLAKDLLRAEAEGQPWTAFLKPPLYVPEGKRVVELLREMRDRRLHVALTVDEYGNIAGLATLEDILETIVGDIRDEFDTAEPSWKAEGPGQWLVRGSLPLERLARLTGAPLASAAAYTSLAGLILSEAGRVPPVGSRFQIGGLAFEVVEATPRRIQKVRVSAAGPPASPPA